jgi:hypothetical protein
MSPPQSAAQYHNSIIDNLSTLRSSEINERERNLLEKIRVLKQENKKLIQLMKDSETQVGEKINKQKRENAEVLDLIGRAWPLIQRAASNFQCEP